MAYAAIPAIAEIGSAVAPSAAAYVAKKAAKIGIKNPEDAVALAKKAYASAQTLKGLGAKYLPQVKSVANTVYSNVHSFAKSPSAYLKKIGGPKGLLKAGMSGAVKASKFISSGATKEIASDIGKGVAAVHDVTGQTKIGSKLESGAQHAHETLEKYNEKFKGLNLPGTPKLY